MTKATDIVVTRLRPAEHRAVKKAAKAAGLTVSAYIRRAVQAAGGFTWDELPGRGEYKRKGKKEGEQDDNAI